MLYYVGLSLIFTLGVGVLFVLAVFQAAAIEVKKKHRLAIVTVDTTQEPGANDPDGELARAA